MKHFYGYRRTKADAEQTGADLYWLDMSPMRTEREAMMHEVALRHGDVVVLFSLRDLGGAARADQVWANKVAERGAAIEIFPLEKPAGRIGRPKKYNPTPEQFRKHRAMWLNGDASELSRLRDISSDYGSEVVRGMCNSRFGWPSREKPIPDWAQPKEPKK